MSDIKVNASDWNQLSEEHRSQITSIMKEHDFLKAGDKIVADPAAPRAKEAAKAASSHLSATARSQKGMTPAEAKPAGFKIPSIACDIAEAAAVAACALVPPPGNVVCVAAAHAGGDVCRKQTK